MNFLWCSRNAVLFPPSILPYFKMILPPRWCITLCSVVRSISKSLASQQLFYEQPIMFFELLLLTFLGMLLRNASAIFKQIISNKGYSWYSYKYERGRPFCCYCHLAFQAKLCGHRDDVFFNFNTYFFTSSLSWMEFQWNVERLVSHRHTLSQKLKLSEFNFLEKKRAQSCVFSFLIVNSTYFYRFLFFLDWNQTT